ncbi:MAG: hypothetical protein M3301_09155 [Chloroflexota bacterium]|nr:hypothetical protein [Chloroflexota bacterium]
MAMLLRGRALITYSAGPRPILFVATLLLAWAFGGAAGTAARDPGGNNGTLKIHAGTDHAEPPGTDRNNEPQLCPFHLHGFNFDASSSGYYRVQQQPPTGTAMVIEGGQWGASASGEWSTGELSLPDGHYKALAKQTDPATPGGEKQKVFWVACSGAGSGQNPGATSGPSPPGEGTSSSETGLPPTVEGGTKPARRTNSSNGAAAPGGQGTEASRGPGAGEAAGNQMGRGALSAWSRRRAGMTLPATSTADGGGVSGGTGWLFLLLSAGTALFVAATAPIVRSAGRSIISRRR